MGCRHGPRHLAPVWMELYAMQAILCSQAEAAKMLAIGKTKIGELVATGQLETVSIGARRLVKIASIQRLAGVGPHQNCELPQ